MRTVSTRIRQVFAGCMLACFVALVACSEEAAPQKTTPDVTSTKPELNARLFAHKSNLVLNEPLFMNVTIENASKNTAHFGVGEVGEGRIAADIVLDTRTPKSRSDWTEVKRISVMATPIDTVNGRSMWVIPAKAVHGVRLRLLHWIPNSDKGTVLVFPTPGQYELRARILLQGDPSTLVTQTVHLSLVAPTSRDQAALEYLQGKQGFRVSPHLFPGAGSHWAQEDLVRFVEKFSGTVYTQYARHTLGAACFVGELEARKKHLKDAMYDETSSDYMRALCASRLLAEVRSSEGRSAGMDVVYFVHKQFGKTYDKHRMYQTNRFAMGMAFYR